MIETLSPAIFLMGPTATGKTDLAIALREHFPVELISVDSALIYRGMDIGSAKPPADQLEAAPHRLIDILDPSEAYSAAEFARCCGTHSLAGGWHHVVLQSATRRVGEYAACSPRHSCRD